MKDFIKGYKDHLKEVRNDLKEAAELKKEDIDLYYLMKQIELYREDAKHSQEKYELLNRKIDRINDALTELYEKVYDFKYED